MPTHRVVLFFAHRAGFRQTLNIDTYDALALIFLAASILAITETDRIVDFAAPPADLDETTENRD